MPSKLRFFRLENQETHPTYVKCSQADAEYVGVLYDKKTYAIPLVDSLKDALSRFPQRFNQSEDGTWSVKGKSHFLSGDLVLFNSAYLSIDHCPKAKAMNVTPTQDERTGYATVFGLAERMEALAEDINLLSDAGLAIRPSM